jgi:hypothetical protein
MHPSDLDCEPDVRRSGTAEAAVRPGGTLCYRRPMRSDLRLVLGLVAGSVLAFALGRWIGGTAPAARTVLYTDGPAATTVPPAPARLPLAEGPVASLGDEIAAQRAQNDELEAELHGVAIPWESEAARAGPVRAPAGAGGGAGAVHARRGAHRGRL